jgi:glycosyltransferase involved in cell wall biosynthesis
MLSSSMATPSTAVKPRNITFVHDTNTFGGLEIVVLGLLRQLDRQRFNPSVMIPGYDDPWSASPPMFVEQVAALGVPILKPKHPGYRPVVSTLADVVRMARLFRAARTDVVHIHTARVGGARKATLSARLAGVPTILRTEHNSPTAFTDPAEVNAVQRFFDALTTLIITVSEHDRWEQMHYFARPAHKLYCSHNGVDLARFDAAHDVRAAKAALGFDPDLPLVGAVGRLDEQKGHRYLIDAAAELLRTAPGVQFVIVGSGALEQKLRDQAAALGVADAVRFAGYQPDPVPYIKAFDIGVMASLHEGFSLSLLEFMAMGKPTVVTDHPGLVEASLDGVTGLVVERRSGPALARGIRQLLDDPERARAMGRAARKRVEAHFTFERFVDDMGALYSAARP